jgi:hypothetical protein
MARKRICAPPTVANEASGIWQLPPKIFDTLRSAVTACAVAYGSAAPAGASGRRRSARGDLDRHGALPAAGRLRRQHGADARARPRR